jgi:hypothetical protein
MRMVSGVTGKGAGFAAGWPTGWYWTGEAGAADNADGVSLGDGSYSIGYVVSHRPVACRR